MIQDGEENAADDVRIPGSLCIDLVSSVNSRGYRLRIAVPRAAPPAAGWPALLVLDGDAYFGLMSDVMRNRGELAGEITPFVVVAIGYPDPQPDAWHTRRVLDFTPSACQSQLLVGHTGGLESFLDTLEKDVLPLLQQRLGIDRQSSAIWGHSLGGLAVLAALLSRPTLLRSWLAVSPAIWAAEADLEERLAGFSRHTKDLCLPRAVHIAVGADEEQLPRRLPPGSQHSREELQRLIAQARMVGRARDWAARLRTLPGHALTLRLDVIADESHVSVAYAALRPGLNLAFDCPSNFSDQGSAP